MKIIGNRDSDDHLMNQSLAYLAAGFVLIISHHFHDLKQIVFFGHLLVGSSFMILISRLFNSPWKRRFSSPYYTFSGAIFIVTLALTIILIIDEYIFYRQANVISETLINSLFITSVITLIIWLAMLSIPLVQPSFSRNKTFKQKIPSLLFIFSIALLLFARFTHLLAIELIPIIVFIFIALAYFLLNKRKLAGFRQTTIYISHLCFVLLFAFIIGGIISFFDNTIPHSWFIYAFIVTFILFSICLLLLVKWRRLIILEIKKCCLAILSILKSIYKYLCLITLFVLSCFKSLLGLLIAIIEPITLYYRVFKKLLDGIKNNWRHHSRNKH